MKNLQPNRVELQGFFLQMMCFATAKFHNFPRATLLRVISHNVNVKQFERRKFRLKDEAS